MLDPEVAPGTYSIVAIDPEQGDVGCAVESRAFPVGAIVPWVQAGVGAVATQSNANLAYGPRGLELLAQGMAPEAVLAELTGPDELREQRQVAVINMAGESARYTGCEVNPWYGSRSGQNYSCQGNLLSGPAVIDRMADAFEASAGEELAERLLRALEAAEAAGGDARGSQSSALVVVRWNGEGEAPNGWRYNLRVDEHLDPVGELRRIFSVRQAYIRAYAAQEISRTGDSARQGEVDELLAAALKLAPHDDYLHALAAGCYYRLGDRDRAARSFRRAIGLNPKARCYLTLFGAAQLYDAEFRSLLDG
jgi:uncharacterized Ntn-hydrolase superfamily protein